MATNDKIIVNHQFQLFGYMKPKMKVPMKAESVKALREYLEKKDDLGAVQTLREMRYRLEAYEKSIGSRPVKK